MVRTRPRAAPHGPGKPGCSGRYEVLARTRHGRAPRRRNSQLEFAEQVTEPIKCLSRYSMRYQRHAESMLFLLLLLPPPP